MKRLNKGKVLGSVECRVKMSDRLEWNDGLSEE